ncbi:glycosyltransferase family 9 protein, partial [bacterium]|nr:glycosyltransferase family 9 protein [bacterium]
MSDFIAIHPGVSKMSIIKNIIKCPDEAFWHGLIKALLNKGKKVLLLGGRDDKELIDKIVSDSEISQNKNFINYFNKTKNIMDMASVMKKANCVICVDSAPLHVAVAVGVRVFAIFGPTNEEKLVPKRDNITIIKNDIPCRPCLWHKRSTNCETSGCLEIDYNLISDKIN